MGQELIIRIEGLEELTQAIRELKGLIGGTLTQPSPARIEEKTPGDQEVYGDKPEVADRDLYFYLKKTNTMYHIKKGDPIEGIPAAAKTTTKEKYDEYYGETSSPDKDQLGGQEIDTDEEEDQDGADRLEEPAITMEALRAELVALGKNGKKVEVKKILTDLGVEQLSDLSPTDYSKAMDAAQKLKKAGK